MDNGSTTISSSNGSLFSNKNFLIIVLIILLVLSFLGINLVIVAGNLIQIIVQYLGPFINQLFSLFGNTTGLIINTSTDIVTDTAKTGIDIAGGTFHDVGNLLQNSSQPVNIASPLQIVTHPTQISSSENKAKLDKSINNSDNKHHEPKPDTSENPIQNPITSGKTNWCLVGEYQGRRGCIEISEHDKCLSGQVFPDQKACLNPTLTNNMHPKPIMKQ
jgi:hypothetical protein